MHSPNQQADDQSFYSIQNHSSDFVSVVEAGKLQVISERSHQQTVPNQPRIPQSSFQLEENDGRSDTGSRTIDMGRFIREDQLSAIEPRELAEIEEHSICLLNEIECLSVSGGVSQEQLREIKKKIASLKSEQLNLQGSLRVAMSMLKTSKTRNELMEQQIQFFKQSHSQFAKKAGPGIASTSPPKTNKQSRCFPQCSRSPSNLNSSLKNIYRQCSLNDRHCIYQNEGYQVEAQYEKIRLEDGSDRLRVWVRVMPYPHIQMQERFLFGVSLDETEGLDCEKPSMNPCACQVKKQFSAWPNKKIILQAKVYEGLKDGSKLHIVPIMVPLPITQFLQPRMQIISSSLKIKFMNQVASSYRTKLHGSLVSGEWIDRIRESWWMEPGMLINCLGCKQMAKVELIQQKSSGEIEALIWGRKGSTIISGLMEFLTFYLME